MSTPETLITAHLETWSSAIKAKSSAARGKKEEFYGIKKLRELILELAVRGLLVPQDPNDEPASELLKKVAAEEARLVKAGEIRKGKVVPKIKENEKPFLLPSSWTWIRLAEAGRDWGQKTPQTLFTYIDVGSINKELGLVSNPSVLSADEAPSRARKIVKEGTVIYSTVRPYLLNIAVVSQSFDPEPIASTAFAIIHPFTGIEASFVYRYLRSPTFINYVESCQTGIAYPAINDKQFFSGVLPLPPLAEQHRIAAKVDELMTLCDQLERQQREGVCTHGTLVETLLGALTAASEQAEFKQAWQRIKSSFDILLSSQSSIDQLKKTILQLAVMGKLTEQDEKDETPEAALLRLQEQRLELARKKLLRKSKVPSCAFESAIPFIPSTWRSVTFDQLALPDNNALKAGPFGSALKKEFYVKSGYKIYGQEQVIAGDPQIGDYYIDAKKYRELESCAVSPGDILVSLVGTIGKILVLPEGIESGIINPRVIKLSLAQNVVLPEFIRLLISSPYAVNFFLKNSHGGTMDILNLTILRALPIPLPPISEQKRIVARADELMLLCDRLKASLQSAQATQLHLADSFVEAALQPGFHTGQRQCA